jgi:S-(hydroxymethyl)glutathione synthase
MSHAISIHPSIEAEKLTIIDASTTIQHHACSACGVPMFGRIENSSYPLYGLKLCTPNCQPPAAGRHHSSPPLCRPSLSRMPIPRTCLRCARASRNWGWNHCLSPTLMDAIATHMAKSKAAA